MSRLKTRIIPPDKLTAIKILHNVGYSNREISRGLDLHHKTVAELLKSEGLDLHYNSSIPIKIVSKTTAQCSRCDDIRPLKEFQKGRKGTNDEYRISYCNACRRAQINKNVNSLVDIRMFLYDRHNRLKRRCKENNITCTITRGELVGIYQKQKGLCFYTDALLICEAGAKLHRDSMSIDKIIPEKGYTADNTVLTTHRINTCKNDLSIDEIKKWMPEWYNRIAEFLMEAA
jgi:hypothetical protein